MKFSISSFPCKTQQVLAPLTVVIISLIAFIFDNSLSDSLVYQRSLVNQGELWRVFSGHFFHTNGFHFLLNGAAVIMLWALHGHFYTIKTYSFVFIVSAIICAIGIHWFSLDINTVFHHVGLILLNNTKNIAPSISLNVVNVRPVS